MEPVSQELASKAYDILIADCGAHDSYKSDFVHYFSTGNPGSEYRIAGSLGFGGKFRFPRFSVDCYREDETPNRLAAIAQANQKLSALVKDLAPELDREW